MNLYAYVEGNPVNWIDPEGLHGEWQWSTPGKDGTITFEGYEDPGTGQAGISPPSPDPDPNGRKFYCGKLSRAISCSMDSLTIGAVIATVYTGGTATPATVVLAATSRVVAVGNASLTLLLCGPSLSTASTYAGAVPGPPWWTTLVAATDAALSALGL